jgi:hypothetical protein
MRSYENKNEKLVIILERSQVSKGSNRHIILVFNYFIGHAKRKKTQTKNSNYNAKSRNLTTTSPLLRVWLKAFRKSPSKIR